MKNRVRVLRWITLIVIVVAMASFLWVAYSAHDEQTRLGYWGLVTTLIVIFLSQLEAFGFFGERKEDQYAILDKKLTEVYSPIHAMIVAFRKGIRSGSGLTIGDLVSMRETGMDLDEVSRISRIFKDHTQDLGNSNLTNWLSLEKELKEKSGFYIGDDRLKWFEELETAYHDLVAQLDKTRKKKVCADIVEPKPDDLLDLYRIADENHRFYVNKRFTIISLYFPAITVVLTGVYRLARDYERIPVCVLAVVLSLFLYSLENRNWILSNTCANASKRLGKRLGDRLHLELNESWRSDLPKSRTLLDVAIKRVASIRNYEATNFSQHRTLFWVTIFLVFYWTYLALSSVLKIS